MATRNSRASVKILFGLMVALGAAGAVSLVACSDDNVAGDTTAADVADGSVGADIQSPNDGLAQGDLVESDDAGAPDAIATPDGGSDLMDGVDGAGDAIVEPVDDPVYQYALAVAQLYADQLEFVAQCCDSVWPSDYVDSPEEVVKAALKLAPLFHQRNGDGEVTFDEQAWSECRQAFAMESCGETALFSIEFTGEGICVPDGNGEQSLSKLNLPLPCMLGLRGTVETGGACQANAACTGDDICHIAACSKEPGVCGPIGELGDACGSHYSCGPLLYCIQGLCSPFPKKGESCTGSMGHCTWQGCSKGYCEIGSQCIDGQCVDLGSEGDPCDGVKGGICGAGLYCDSMKCLVRKAAGESCTSTGADTEECAGLCDGVTNLCVGPKADGEPCPSGENAECLGICNTDTLTCDNAPKEGVPMCEVRWK